MGFLLVKLFLASSNQSLVTESEELEKAEPFSGHLTIFSAGERSDDLSGSHLDLSYMMLRGYNKERLVVQPKNKPVAIASRCGHTKTTWAAVWNQRWRKELFRRAEPHFGQEREIPFPSIQRIASMSSLDLLEREIKIRPHYPFLPQYQTCIANSQNEFL